MHASLYLVKCDAVLNRANDKQGEKQSVWTKFCSGICLFFISLYVFWAPLLMYSSGNPTNIASPIKDASFKIDLQTLDGILYSRSKIQVICCQPDANTLWHVPDIVLRRFIQSLNWDMHVSFPWILIRDRPKGKEVAKCERNVDPSYLPKPADVQNELNGTTNSFGVNNIYPRHFRVTGSGEIRPFNELYPLLMDYEWSSFHDIYSLNLSTCGALTGPVAIIVSEETPCRIGETLSKSCIWGLYITFVLAVGRLMAICEAVYAARPAGELGVEEVLYWTLIKIYRSPHMPLEYTKPD
ncbi:Piezo non-specific cation channel, R-Ras-binding domain [Dillenia turbinata]|uniref:Piezo non-specific cation channel, R-Ras-binding domain n=1 Tax=Dillenia turbinata TaxID=194707 RepID=A0AAN8VWN9_9MAGN